MFLVIAFDFEKYHDEAEEIKNIIERYIYVDDEKAFKKCRKKWDEEMIIGIDGVQWIPENVGEIRCIYRWKSTKCLLALTGMKM